MGSRRGTALRAGVPEREFVIREEEKPYLYRVEIGGRKADYLLFNPAMIVLTPAPAPARS
jgi:hypothetical protein